MYFSLTIYDYIHISTFSSTKVMRRNELYTQTYYLLQNYTCKLLHIEVPLNISHG
jgi:hypothetical protein